MAVKKPLEPVLIAMNAALYAGVGYLTFLGIFAPVVGTVRFWPSVVIPAVFAVLYSPRIGALGAGLGIFISDMLIHGDPVLSITVGVTSNVAGFYILGVLARTLHREGRSRVLAILLQTLPLVVSVLALGLLDYSTGLIFVGAAVLSFAIGLFYSLYKPIYAGLVAASSIGLLAGSTIIGLGVWAYSQFFSLPAAAGGGAQLPLTAAAIVFLWTYLSEIPFLMTLVPPLVAAVRKAVPLPAR
jgi:uncharacterized membrane protein